MGESEHRQIARDSLFVLAELRLDGVEGEHKVRVRNLSSGGLMVEGELPAVRGQLTWVNIRNIGWVEGSIAWIEGPRCGVAFREEIDPKIARAPVTIGEGSPRYTRPPLGTAESVSRLRKI